MCLLVYITGHQGHPCPHTSLVHCIPVEATDQPDQQECSCITSKLSLRPCLSFLVAISCLQSSFVHHFSYTTCMKLRMHVSHQLNVSAAKMQNDRSCLRGLPPQAWQQPGLYCWEHDWEGGSQNSGPSAAGRASVAAAGVVPHAPAAQTAGSSALCLSGTTQRTPFPEVETWTSSLGFSAWRQLASAGLHSLQPRRCTCVLAAATTACSIVQEKVHMTQQQNCKQCALGSATLQGRVLQVARHRC